MSRIDFHRPARAFAPTPTEQRISVAPPPQKPAENAATGWLSLLLPLLSSVSMAAYMISFGRPWMVLLGGGFIVASVVAAVVVRNQTKGQSRRALTVGRTRYLGYLAEVRAQARQAAAAQHFAGGYTHPHPERLPHLAAGRRRVWERRPGDADFLHVRVGAGWGEPALRLAPGGGPDPLSEQDPVSRRTAEQLLRDFERVRQAPAWVDLASCGVLSVVGPAEQTRAATRALLCQVAALHAPDDIRIVVLAADPPTGPQSHPTAPVTPFAAPVPATAVPAMAASAARTTATAITTVDAAVPDTAPPTAGAVPAPATPDRITPATPPTPAAGAAAEPGTGEAARAWEWAKWLPHTRDEQPADPTQGAVPLVAQTLEALADVLEDALEQARTRAEARALTLSGRGPVRPPRRLLVVLDGYHPDAAWARQPLITGLLEEAGPLSGIHLVCLARQESVEPGRVDVRARIGADRSLVLDARVPGAASQTQDAVADQMECPVAEQTARALAPLRLSGEVEQVLSRTTSLTDMLGITDLDGFDPTTLWRTPSDEDVLKVPVGVTGDGSPLLLDLKEAAQGGFGPHGLVVGATGSGKSELLRTLVTALTATHPPDLLSFVLVDFKGGATFAGVTELPHVAGLITNLADDLALVDRVRAALTGEQQRRQRMLRDAGNVDSVREYQQLHAQGARDTHGRPLEPMPYLLVIVDEFGELLSQRPDFIDLFVQIGRVGRSLGIHLLLATQRLDEGRLRGLESHLSYRIGLRTFSAAESRAVLGTADAYHLPSIPGSAYLKVDDSLYERFRVAHSTAAYQDPGNQPPPLAKPTPLPFTLRTTAQVRGEATEPGPTVLPARLPGQRTQMQVLVQQLERHGTAAHQIWLPPLPPAIEADAVLAPLRTAPARGLHAQDWPQGQLAFPVGVVDLPLLQEQRALLLDLAGAHAHLALVGAPQSGRSTFWRTALLSAMLTHTPEELQVIAIDFGGGTLAALEDAPHVRGVATRHEEPRVRRALATAMQTLDQRERLFERLRIDSAAQFRAMRAAGELPAGQDAADLLLVIDNWAGLREMDDQVDEVAHALATRGLGVGIHLWLSANRWMEIRAGLRDNLPGRLELRLNDATESEVSRAAARTLHGAPPGRGVVAPGHVFHTALPRIDGGAGTQALAKAQALLVNDLALTWTGQRAPKLRTLPDLVTREALDQALTTTAAAGDQDSHGGVRVPVGLRESDLGPAFVDLRPTTPHLLVLGDAGSGKTSFLRSWITALAQRCSPYDARFVVVDYRRGLLGTVPEEHLGAYAPNAELAQAYVEQVVDKLKERLPPAGITVRELRERDWWSGPELYVVVDDYDLVASSGQGRTLLAPLTDYLTHAQDIGLHMVLARRVSGMTRAQMSEPLTARLQEFGAGGLILSGDPREGVLLDGHRAVPRPPGRGLLVTPREGAEVVQLVHDPLPADD